MKKVKLLLLLLFVYQNIKAQGGEIVSDGVLFGMKNSVFMFPDTLRILNNDKTLNLTIENENNSIRVEYFKNTSSNDSQKLKKIYPFYYKETDKYNAPLPKVMTRAFYPDDGVLVIDAKKSTNNEYEVYINGEWKIIKTKGLTYKSWNCFIKNTLVKLPEGISLHTKNSLISSKLQTPKNLSYKVLKVKGDWIKIKCNTACEGCENGKEISGWVRWKSENEILVMIYYVC